MKKHLIIVSIILLILISIMAVASAEDKDGDKTVQPKVEKVGGVELEISRFPLEHYQAHNQAEDGMIKGAIVSLSNTMLAVTQIIVLVVDKAMDLFMSAEPIDNFSSAITNVSKQMYNVLKKSFGEILFVFMIGFVVYLFFIKGSFKEGMRRFALFFVVMVVSALWVNKAGYWIESLNALSIEGQGKLITVGNKLVGAFSDKSDSTLKMDDVKKGQEIEGTTAVLRNFYFDSAMKSPYLVTNYGTPNEQIIVLAIAFFLPFAFILSYVPQFAYSGFVSLGRMFALFVLKALLTLVLVFVYAICVITHKTIPPTNLGMYFLNVVAMSVILIIAFLKRDKIINFVTAGKVQNVDANLLENTRKAVVQPSWEGAKKVSSGIGEWKKKRDAKKAAEEKKKAAEEEQYLADRRRAPQNQSNDGNSKFDRTSQNNPPKNDVFSKKEIERGRQLEGSNVDSKADDYKPPLYVADGGDVERTDQNETGASASNQLPKVDIERSEQATKDQLAEESNNMSNTSNPMSKVDVERSEQATKDQLAEESYNVSNALNPTPKVDVERSEQATKDQLAEEGNNNSRASSKIPIVDAERSDQGVSEKTLTEESMSNQKPVSPVSNANVARNEQTQSKEKVSASVPKTENETVKASDAQPKVKRVIQQQPKHVKIELDQIESRQSKSDRGGSGS